MGVRDLTIADSINLKGHKEFNHLRVSNLDVFFKDYRNKYDYYNPPFAILADLETQVMYENNPQETILCEYKPLGDVIFQLKRITTDGNGIGQIRIVEYEFQSFVS